MGRLLCVLRSALFVAWLAVTVVPWALAVVLVSIFVRGDPIYWMCVGWLRTAVFGARGDLRRARPRARHGQPADGRRQDGFGDPALQAPVDLGDASPIPA